MGAWANGRRVVLRQAYRLYGCDMAQLAVFQRVQGQRCKSSKLPRERGMHVLDVPGDAIASPGE